MVDIDKIKVIVRLAQAFLEFITMALASSVIASFKSDGLNSPSDHGFVVFCAVTGLFISLIYAFAHILYNLYSLKFVKEIVYWKVELVVTAFYCIFWFSGLIATATRFGGITCDDLPKAAGASSLKSIVSACNVSKATAAFCFFCLALWLASLFLISQPMFKGKRNLKSFWQREKQQPPPAPKVMTTSSTPSAADAPISLESADRYPEPTHPVAHTGSFERLPATQPTVPYHRPVADGAGSVVSGIPSEPASSAYPVSMGSFPSGAPPTLPANYGQVNRSSGLIPMPEATSPLVVSPLVTSGEPPMSPPHPPPTQYYMPPPASQEFIPFPEPTI